MEQHAFSIVEDGDWEDILAFCEQLSDALEHAVSEYEQRRFEAWRPKPGEEHQLLRGRSADEAAIHETRIEQHSNGMKAEMREAGGHVREGGRDMVRGHPNRSIHEFSAASNAAAKGLLPGMIQLVRSLERGIYYHIIGRTNPVFFESHSFTARIDHHTLQRGQYTIKVTFDDDVVLEAVSGELPELDAAT